MIEKKSLQRTLETVKPHTNNIWKKLVRLIFSRVFFVGVALLLQLGWLLALALLLNSVSKYISFAISVLSLVAVLWLVNKKINPSYKLVWTIVILTFPVIGLFLYLFFGKSRVPSAMERNYEKASLEASGYLQESYTVREQLEKDDLDLSVQSCYIRDYAGSPLKDHTAVTYYPLGDDWFPDLVKALESAEHFIFLEYFIINDGIVWQTVLKILERKAAEGVEVRLIYDDFGCITTLPHHFYKSLQEKGIQCAAFNPFLPLLNVILNNRDHRKICVVDGHTGFTGGTNLADEYINEVVRFGHWKDTAVRLVGDGVWNLTAMFLKMWEVITRVHSEYSPYMPHVYHPGPFWGEGYVQPYSDTPLDNEVLGENVYLNMINRAKKYIYICTPYLIIDNEMMTALCLASKSGVDVRIMTPGIPDKKMVFLLTQSYYEQLVEAGVKIFEYCPGFLHAKSFVCDDKVAVVGTINMDYRSLYLHFENGVWMCYNQAVMDIKADYLETLKKCKPISLAFCKNRNMVVRAMQSVLRLLAPMM